MWPAFFARVRPVTNMAKPTCMKSTRKPVIKSHEKLIDTRRWPDSLANAWTPTWLGVTDFAPVAVK